MTRRTFFCLGIVVTGIALGTLVRADPSTKGDKGVGPGKPAEKPKAPPPSGPDPNRTPAPKDRN